MATETKSVGHTPGPWTIERPFGEPGVYIQCPTSALVATCHEPDPNTFNVDRRCSIDANARLIAAAPTMEKALRSVIESLSTTIGSGTIDKEDIAAAVSAARAALTNL